MIECVEIKLSRKKGILALLGAIVFIVLCCLFIIEPKRFINPIFRNEQFIFFVGIVGVILFGVFAFFIFRKLFDNKFGLIISEEGIFDNSSATSVGLIQWKDIVSYKVTQVVSTKFIMIEVNNSQEYIDKCKSLFIKKSLEANNKLYGTPILIASNSLMLDFKDLEEVIKDSFKKYK
ncbi:STM3941 family protein [uncultured Empedobacter sp.]|uniref:STM3941 family protein n=1 Tax=uncultured Empedobacter sp. TaxID=410844 RepID=UPI0025FA75F5|nr:STM3941 family protein [uncultured Empedobacter sp.]